MARTKTITIEGEEFRIAPLNIDQVEEYLNESNFPPQDDQIGWRNRMISIIAASFNNASSASNGDRQTVDSLRKSLDLVSMPALHNAVLEMSGLRVKSPNEAPTVGETQAVPSA